MRGGKEGLEGEHRHRETSLLPHSLWWVCFQFHEGFPGGKAANPKLDFNSCSATGFLLRSHTCNGTDISGSWEADCDIELVGCRGLGV